MDTKAQYPQQSQRPVEEKAASTVGRRSVLSAGAGITAAVAGGSLVGRWSSSAAAQAAPNTQAGSAQPVAAKDNQDATAPISFGFAAQDSRGLPTEIILNLPEATASSAGSLQLTIHARELDALGLVTQRSSLKPVLHDGQGHVPGVWPAPVATGSGGSLGSSAPSDGLMSSSAGGAQGSAGQPGAFRGVTVFDLGARTAGRTELLVHWEGAPSGQRMQVVATLVVRNERHEFEQYQTQELLIGG